MKKILFIAALLISTISLSAKFKIIPSLQVIQASGEFKDKFSYGYGINVNAQYMIIDKIGIGVGIGYSDFILDNNYEIGNYELSWLHLNGNVTYYFSDKRISPYLGINFGGYTQFYFHNQEMDYYNSDNYYTSYSTDTNEYSDIEADIKVGIAPIAGLEIKINKRISINANIKYDCIIDGQKVNSIYLNNRNKSGDLFALSINGGVIINLGE